MASLFVFPNIIMLWILASMGVWLKQCDSNLQSKCMDEPFYFWVSGKLLIQLYIHFYSAFLKYMEVSSRTETTLVYNCLITAEQSDYMITSQTCIYGEYGNKIWPNTRNILYWFNILLYLKWLKVKVTIIVTTDIFCHSNCSWVEIMPILLFWKRNITLNSINIFKHFKVSFVYLY